MAKYLVSSGGSLPSGTKIGEEGYPKETKGADSEDLAYKGRGDTVPPHSRALSTALRSATLTGVVINVN